MPTSVPVWPAEPPGIDTGGRSYAVLSIGPPAHAVADTWLARLAGTGRHVARLRIADGDDSGAAWVAEQASCARVGWRLLVTGPEADVLAATAAARSAGALDAEITAHVTGTATRNVVCIHCRARTAGEVSVGERLACEGCGRELVVYHHVSRRLGGYMGYMADAELVP